MAQCYYDYRCYFFHSSLYCTKRERGCVCKRESIDDDCCHSSEPEKERERQKARREGNKQSSSNERYRKEHHLTSDVHHCLTSKTDKTRTD